MKILDSNKMCLIMNICEDIYTVLLEEFATSHLFWKCLLSIITELDKKSIQR